MDLHVIQHEEPGGVRRIARLSNVIGQGDVEIVFDMQGAVLNPPAVLDGFVFGVIFYAMRLGQDLRVCGSVSRTALLNLNEFQEAWVLWKPDLYRKVQILPDRLVDSWPSIERKAIAAFSGGVDSTFTILRHKLRMFGDSSYPLNQAVLMVDFHGPEFADQMKALKKRVTPFLDELGVDLLSLKTNLKELKLQDWEDSCMAQLACCLNNYSGEFYYALVAGTEAYNALVLPWGSNPATDYLLSGDTMRLVHDGAGYSRTEKVAQIANQKAATLAIQVCWEGGNATRNCGVCEKCIRTQLNFKAAGVEHAPCFDKPLDLQLLNTMPLRNNVEANELRSIYAYATKAGIDASWVHALRLRIQRGLAMESKEAQRR